MMQKLFIAAFSFAVIAAPNVWSDELSPVGLWKNIDDESGKARSLIRITEVNGELSGKIEKLFLEAGEAPDPKCDKCTDSRKDQPILGMVFMSGLKKNGNEYSGGEILDPHNGKVYKSKMEMIDGGKKLKVRGFVGISLFGRSQTWLRQE